MTIYTEKCSPSITEQAVGSLANPSRILRNWMKNQQLKYKIREERRQLAQMPEAMLKDIGVNRYDALHEAARDDIPAARVKPPAGN